ncbi:hypothetical protein HUX88_18700 [Duganella sp. BJB1802]|nr:hypothetical protein [Duganella sp. BJB1802]
MSVWIPCPEDLAITKLGRLAPLDLLASLEPYRPASPLVTGYQCKDVRAIEWGASADLMPFVEELLPYQTRHYAATI